MDVKELCNVYPGGWFVKSPYGMDVVAFQQPHGLDMGAFITTHHLRSVTGLRIVQTTLITEELRL